MKQLDISLYAILDPARSKGRPLDELAAIAVRTGATLLQYRDKQADIRTLVANARRIKLATKKSGVPFLINDRVDVALAIGADGVHLGQQDMVIAEARKILGKKAIIGLSIKTLEDAQNAPVELLDYAFIGGVFDTRSKANTASIGVAGWMERADILRNRAPGLLIGAIAGIDAGNAGALLDAGCDGIALISALFMAGDVAAATREMAALIKTTRDRKSV